MRFIKFIFNAIFHEHYFVETKRKLIGDCIDNDDYVDGVWDQDVYLVTERCAICNTKRKRKVYVLIEEF